jgi:hypothetical protein
VLNKLGTQKSLERCTFWSTVIRLSKQLKSNLDRFISILSQYIHSGVRGSVVGWGTMLQAGRLRDRIPDEVDFFNLPNPSSCTMAPGSIGL